MPQKRTSLRQRMLNFERDSAHITGVVLHPLATDAFVVRLVVRDLLGHMRRLNPEAVGWDLVMDRLCRDLVVDLRPTSALWLLDEVLLNFFPHGTHVSGEAESERTLDLGVVAALASARLNTHLQTILGTLFCAKTDREPPNVDPLEMFRATELKVLARATRLPPRQVFYYNLWRVVHDGGLRVARLWAAMNAPSSKLAQPTFGRKDELVASLGGAEAYARLVPAVFRLGRVIKMLDVARGDVLLVSVDFAVSYRDAHWHIKKLLETQSPEAAIDSVQARAAAVLSLDARYMRQDVFVRL